MLNEKIKKEKYRRILKFMINYHLSAEMLFITQNAFWETTVDHDSLKEKLIESDEKCCQEAVNLDKNQWGLTIGKIK